MGDNPAYEDFENSAANQHRVMWEPLYESGLVGQSNSSFRALMVAEGLNGRPESEATVLVRTAVDTDSDGDIDPVATTATAGTPGSYSPAGCAAPFDLAAINSAAPLASPLTDWTTGQRVVLGNADTCHWLADTLPAVTGESDTEVFSSTAHGLAVGDIVIFTAVTGGTGISTNTVYRVATVPTVNSFTLNTNAGVALTFTADLTAATTITGAYLDGNAA